MEPFSDEWYAAHPHYENPKEALTTIPSSASPTCSIAVEPTRDQKKKLKFLFDKGGKCTAATFAVGMPDGATAFVDPFGRVEWKRQ